MWAWQHVDGQPRARESEKIVFAEVLTLPKLHAELVLEEVCHVALEACKHQAEDILICSSEKFGSTCYLDNRQPSNEHPQNRAAGGVANRLLRLWQRWLLSCRA